MGHNTGFETKFIYSNTRRSESMEQVEDGWMLKMRVEHTGKVRDRQVNSLGTQLKHSGVQEKIQNSFVNVKLQDFNR